MGININIYNGFLFQIAWFACVLGGTPVALLAAPLAIWLHLRYVSGDYRELALLFQVGLLGLFVDTGLIYLGVLTGPGVSLLPPPWLTLLWPLFATTLCYCMEWFQKRPWAAVPAGAFAGPTSYFAGVQLSDISFGLPLVTSLAIIALVWAAVFPLCLWMAVRYEQGGRTRVAGQQPSARQRA